MRFASLLLLGSLWLRAAVVFEPNRGQADPGANFVARTESGNVAVSAGGIAFRRRDGSQAWIRFSGAHRSAPPAAEQPLPGVSHYAFGSDLSHWIWDVPHYARLRYTGIYPGIDVCYHAGPGEVEFDFLLAPGADATRIAMKFSSPIILTAGGDLTGRASTLRRPQAWQIRDGKRISVIAEFTAPVRGRVGLRIGAYDRTLPLVIDPTVVFATYLGGSENEADTRIATGPDGAVYVAGTTMSADFPASLPANDLLNRPEILLTPQMYVSRMKPDGSALDWSLFLGGSGAQRAWGLRRDELGNLYLLGATTSPNFPVTAGAYKPKIHPSLSDLVVLKLDAQTGRIKASTFLGAATSVYLSQSNALHLAVDAAGGVYVAGPVIDDGFATTPGAYQSNPPKPVPTSGNSHSFVMRMNTALSAVVYATLFDPLRVSTMEVDTGGNLVLGGTADRFANSGPQFQPVNPIPGVSQDTGGQAFLTKLNAMGTAAVFATLLHGDGFYSAVSDIKIAADGSIYVTGYGSGNFPQVTPLSVDPVPIPGSPQSQSDPAPFLAKVPAGGGGLLQSTLFSGAQFPTAPALAYPAPLRLLLMPGRSPCVLNAANGLLPQTAGGLVGRRYSFDSYSFGGSMVCLNANETGMEMQTLLPPGSNYTEAAAMPDGSALLAGVATGAVTTPGVLQSRFGGGVSHDQLFPYPLSYGDAYLLRLFFNNPSPKVQTVVPESLILQTSGIGAGTVDLYGSGFAYGTEATFNNLPVKTQFVDAGHLILSEISPDAYRPGANQISVSLPAPGGGQSSAILTGINPTPSSLTISPTSAAQGAGETKIVIRATNMTRDSTLVWNGAARRAQYVADAPARNGHLELVLPPEELAEPNSIRVALANPGPGGGISAEVLFLVQPSSGTTIPTLSTATSPAIFGNSVNPIPTTLILNGAGFTMSTKAWWDGVEVPVTVISANLITIQPTADDLTRWGAHDVYVANGPYRSATVRQFVGRFLGPNRSIADPVRQRLYIVNLPFNFSSDPQFGSLSIFDLRSGDLLQTVDGLALPLLGLTLSTDGHYLYLLSGSQPARMRRYDTLTAAFDLEWNVDIGYNPALFPVPGSPEAVVVWPERRGVVIFDRDRPRLIGSIAAGFSENDKPAFVTRSRVYINNPSTSCWQWMDFDSDGILGGSPSCSTDEPADVVHDGGFVFLRDGQQYYVVSGPIAPGSPFTPGFSWLPDPERRRVEQISTTQLTDFSLDDQQQTVRAQLSMTQAAAYLNADGGTVVVTGGWMTVIP